MIGYDLASGEERRSVSDKPVVVAKNPELGERCAATPAIADDALYIRTATHLYAFAEIIEEWSGAASPSRVP